MLINGPDVIDASSSKVTTLKLIGLVLMHEFRFIGVEILLNDCPEMIGQLHLVR